MTIDDDGQWYPGMVGAYVFLTFILYEWFSNPFLQYKPQFYLVTIFIEITCLIWRLARLTVIQEVPGSIPGYTLEIFLEV